MGKVRLQTWTFYNSWGEIRRRGFGMMNFGWVISVGGFARWEAWEDIHSSEGKGKIGRKGGKERGEEGGMEMWERGGMGGKGKEEGRKGKDGKGREKGRKGRGESGSGK
ncbi:hypothetical protein Tco_1229756 [Tanacetum coccineum]